MSQIESVIRTALQSTDNRVRNDAEQEIYRLVQRNPPDFFVKIALIIGSDQKDDILRTSAASIFKRLIAIRNSEGVYFWDLVEPKCKAAIKEELLSTLISHDVSLMRAGGNALAQIASIQIPRNEWLDILGTLSENTSHKDYNIRRASIITLGFICNQLRNSESMINPQICREILASLLMCLNKEPEIIGLSLQAIRDSIQFLRPILQNYDLCNRTLQFILPIMNNPTLREHVYEVMYEFCKHCYIVASNFLELIVKFTVAHMQMRNEDSCKACALWQTIGTEYLQLIQEQGSRLNERRDVIPNLVMKAQPHILSEVMGLMLIMSRSDMELVELRESAITTLTVIVQCCDREVVERITEGVTMLLQSQNSGDRQATVLLFSTLCNYADRFDIENRFRSAFVHLYKLIEDPEVIVVRNTLSGLGTIAEFFPEVFMENQEIRQIFHHLLLMAKGNDDMIRIGALVLLCNITEACEKVNSPITEDPKQHMRDLVEMFEKGLSGRTDSESNEKVVIITMNIIMATNNIAIIHELMKHLIGLYQRYYGAQIGDKQLVLQEILGLIHTCMLAMSKSAMPKIELKDLVFGVIDRHIQLYGIEPEGINMISAAAACYKRDFRSRIDNYWRSILMGLDLPDQKLLFKATLSCLSDIARHHEHHILDRVTPLFQRLLDMMTSGIDRELKTDILKCFGDLAMGLKRYAQPFLDQILTIVNSCFDAVMTFSEQESDKAYAEELKEALIDMYGCLVFSINEQNNCNIRLANHFPRLVDFIIRSNDVKYKPTVDYLRGCIYLIFDSALFYSSHAQYKSQVSKLVESEQVRQLIQKISHFHDRPEVKELLMFVEDKLRIRR